RKVVGRRTDALQERRDAEVLVAHGLQRRSQRCRVVTGAGPKRGEERLLFLVEVREERLRELGHRFVEQAQLRVVIPVDASDLRGEGTQEGERLAKMRVVLVDDVIDERRRGELLRPGSGFTPQRDRLPELPHEAREVDSALARRRFDAEVPPAAEIDAMALKDLRALGVIRDDLSDRLRSAEHGVTSAHAESTARAIRSLGTESLQHERSPKAVSLRGRAVCSKM